REAQNANAFARDIYVPFLGCAVNIDVPSKRVRILCLTSAQPNNAGNNRIATRGIRRDDFACATSILEHRARRGIVANFLRDLQLAQWSATAPRPIAQSELGRGDGINDDQVTSIEKR